TWRPGVSEAAPAGCSRLRDARDGPFGAGSGTGTGAWQGDPVEGRKIGVFVTETKKVAGKTARSCGSRRKTHGSGEISGDPRRARDEGPAIAGKTHAFAGTSGPPFRAPEFGPA